jgi:hypothetical protein
MALAIESCAPIPAKVRRRHATSVLQGSNFLRNSFPRAARLILGCDREQWLSPTSHWSK